MRINLPSPTAVLIAVAPPNPDATVPPGLGDFANQILGWLKWGVLFSGVPASWSAQ